MAYLVLNGHPLRGVGRDKRDDRFMVFYFDEEDSELDILIQKYKQSNYCQRENRYDKRKGAVS